MKKEDGSKSGDGKNVELKLGRKVTRTRGIEERRKDGSIWRYGYLYCLVMK